MSYALPWIAGICVLLGVVVACRGTSSEEPVEPPAEQSSKPIPMASTTLLRGNLSGVRASEVAVARSEDEWRILWRRHGGLQLPGPDLPEVDFEQNMVLAVFLGERPTGGFQLDVDAIDMAHSESGQAKMMVHARETKPEDQSIQPQMTVSPFHMLLVPKSEALPELHMQ